LLGVRTRRQFADLLQDLRIENRDRVVVSEANKHQRIVLAQRYAARPLADLDGARDLELVEVDDRDRIALLVGDIGRRRQRGTRNGAKARQKGKRGDTARHAFH